MGIIWQDKKHWAFWRLSFTTYKLSTTKLYIETGLFTTDYEEVLLYRIVDCKCSISLLQRLFGTGSVTLIGLDRSTPVVTLENIKNPLKVKNAISELAIRNKRQSGLVELS